MDGVLNVYKPTGPTSHDVVNKVRRTFGQKKVGHAGTLDPLATGVLVVCLGKATRIVECLMCTTKQYRARMVLGQVTSTQDCTGEVISECDASHITESDVIEAAAAFVGDIMQMPPMMSALKHNGTPLYKLAREGKTIERALRPVTIHSIEVISIQPGEHPEAELLVSCSSGTYIRTLCHDIGEKLSCGAQMSMLERVRVGHFGVDSAYSLEDIETAREDGRLENILISIADALGDYPAAIIEPDDLHNALHGLPVRVSRLDREYELVRMLTPDGMLIGLGNSQMIESETLVKPCKVFAEVN